MTKYILGIIFCLLFASSALALTEITTLPLVINEDDEVYFLADDLVYDPDAAGASSVIYIKARNVTIQGRGHSITYSSGTGAGIRVEYTATNCKIYDLTLITCATNTNGIVLPALPDGDYDYGSHTIRNCKVIHSGSLSAITVSSNVLIENCVLYHSIAAKTALGINATDSLNVKIVNSTLISSGASGVAMSCAFTDALADTIYMYNNIFATASERCVRFTATTGNWTLPAANHTNNRYWRSSGVGDQHVQYNGANVTGTNITNFEATATTGDPSFVTQWSDFALQSGSDALGDGTNTHVISAFDLAGNPRIVSTVDLGAYEYTASPAATGACCFDDGSCAIKTELFCESTMYLANYAGDAVTCVTADCQPATGACCLLDGSCHLLNQTDCSTADAEYKGNNTTCDVNPCTVIVNTSDTHPRVYMYADSLDVFRARFNAGGPMEEVGIAAKAWADSKIGNAAYATYHNATYVEGFALAYVLTETQVYADTAIAIAMKLARDKIATYNEGGGIGAASVLALVYDYCYDIMTPEQRSAIRDSVYFHHKTAGRSGGEYDGLEDYTWQPRDVQWSYMVALAKDYTDISKKQYMLKKLKACFDWYDDKFIACCDDVRPQGSIDGYSMVRTGTVLTALDVFKHSTNYEDYSGDAYTSPYFVNTPTFWIHRLTSRNEVHRTPAKYNPQMTKSIYMSLFGSSWDCPECQYIATENINELITDGVLDDDGYTQTGIPSAIITFYKPGAASVAPAASPRLSFDFRDTGANFIYSRSGWAISDISDDINTFFFNGPDFEWGQTRGQGHFTISRGNDNLLIDSGRYGRDNDIGFNAYYKMAVAHNVMRVYDEDEVFPTLSDPVNTVTMTAPNDGGMNRFDLTCGGTNLYPNCTLSNIPAVECRGSVDKYSASNYHTFLEATTTPAYATDKISSAQRSWMYIKPGIWLLYDKIRLAKTGPLAINTFHTVDRPVSNDDTLDVKHGDIDHGGVFFSTTADQVTVDRGDSKAVLTFLENTGATADSVYIIGGGNAADGLWKQCYDDADVASYVADCADQSYEFWVDGLNFPPEQDGYGGLKDDRFTFQDEAGDWRFEHTLGGGTAAADITDLVAIWAGPEASAASYSASLATFGTTKIVDITVDDGNYIAAMPAPGTASTDTLSYTTSGDYERHVIAGMTVSTSFRIEEEGATNEEFYVISSSAGVLEFVPTLIGGGTYKIGAGTSGGPESPSGNMEKKLGRRMGKTNRLINR